MAARYKVGDLVQIKDFSISTITMVLSAGRWEQGLVNDLAWVKEEDLIKIGR